MLKQLLIYLEQVLLDLRVGHLEPVEALGVVAGDGLHHLADAPVHVRLHSQQGVLADQVQVVLECNLLLVVGQILAQKHHQKGNADVAHALHIAAGWVAVVPDVEQPFGSLLDLRGLADRIIFHPYPFNVHLDGVGDLALLF